MASNFFGKLRDLVSNVWSETDTPSHHASHISATPVVTSSGQQSSVEKYLAKQAAAQSSSAPKALTGVEKYLAKQAGGLAIQATAAAKEALTGVDKYLAKQNGGSAAVTAKAPAKKPDAPLSKVDKYLASQSASKEKPAKKTEETVKTDSAAKKKNEVAAESPVAAQKAASVKAKSSATAAKVEEPAKKAESTNKEVELVKDKIPAAENPVDAIDLSTGAAQCQAATVKGTQCRNTIRLNTLQQTIGDKTYIFAACNQHNNNTFKPFQQIQ